MHSGIMSDITDVSDFGMVNQIPIEITINWGLANPSRVTIKPSRGWPGPSLGQCRFNGKIHGEFTKKGREDRC